MAEAVQKYREVSQFADQDARGQIMAHFGVSLSPVLSDKCMYLGGSSSNIDLLEVVNTNLTGEFPFSDKGRKDLLAEWEAQNAGLGHRMMVALGYKSVDLLKRGKLVRKDYEKPRMDNVIEGRTIIQFNVSAGKVTSMFVVNDTGKRHPVDLTVPEVLAVGEVMRDLNMLEGFVE